ncbi:hypothetical protein BBD40_08025 [Paenibacillus ihbetae]|uniref:Uncharacterized protein n=1 Tax=Paenibacillus ihbetae TaxID=1870820 RepID=A0ABX3JYY8_9BACL|nr:hypothetical protein BBD40_08025 [Paenibacillus ihbetae]
MSWFIVRFKEKGINDIVQLIITSTDGSPISQKAEGFVGNSVAARRLHVEKNKFHEKHPQLGCFFFIFTNPK